MLDLKTTLIILLINATLQGAVWVFVWISQRHLFELKFIAAAYIAFAAGLLLVVLRGPEPAPWHIVLDNTIINLALALVADGLARFLSRKPLPALGIGVVIFSVLFWSLALALDPANVAIRTHGATGVTILCIAVMIWTLASDRSQPRLLRWITIFFLSCHAAASVARSVAIHLQETFREMPAATTNAQAIYFFEINVFITAYFLCQLLMVGIRLSADLRQKNEALSHEVNERRKLQEQLGAALATEKALREEQHQLLRMVTHEFRTPLAVVDRAAEMIAVVLPSPPEAVASRLDSIRQAVRRLVQLIDRFLDSERLDQEAMQPEQIDLAEFTGSIARHFDMTGSGHRLTFNMADDLPRYFGDQDMLATVVINLVENALKYSPEDTPVTVSIDVADGDIVIGVRDRGIGIPEAERRSVGRRFFRASNTRAATGTGLGLYNARKLLEYHQGELSLEVPPDGGTLVLIRLPLHIHSIAPQDPVA